MRKPLNTIVRCLLPVLFIALAMVATAQEPDKRHVTPVKPETNRVQPPPKGTDEKVIQQYLSGDSTAAIADYILPYSAALHKDNFYTCQFHPEKSGKVGERILRNFLEL